MERIAAMAGGNYPVIRIMPNTPCAVGAGVVLYDANALVTGEQLDFFTAAMAGAGLLDRLEERLYDAGSAVAGCGPAFLSLFLEALADGGVTCGLPRQKALTYAAKMAEGTAKLMLETNQHPGVMKDAVCSPAGSTIAGVRALEEHAFRLPPWMQSFPPWSATVSLGNKPYTKRSLPLGQTGPDGRDLLF